MVGDIPHRSSHCAAAVGCRHPCSCRHQKVGLHLPNTRLYLAYLRADHRRKYRIIKTTADDYCLQLVLKCIGSVINNIISNIDDTDIQREITNMFIRTNILIRKFHKCTVAVKTVLFRSYCVCLYDAALWSNFHVGMLNKLRSSYNRYIKIFLGFNKRDSLTNNLFTLCLPSFDALMTNAAVSYTRLCTSCTNSTVTHLRQVSLYSV